MFRHRFWRREGEEGVVTVALCWAASSEIRNPGGKRTPGVGGCAHLGPAVLEMPAVASLDHVSYIRETSDDCLRTLPPARLFSSARYPRPLPPCQLLPKGKTFPCGLEKKKESFYITNLVVFLLPNFSLKYLSMDL